MSDLLRCEAEARQCEQLLREGHPGMEGLLMGLQDWWAELREINAVRTV